jgi:hypothetical protein
MGGNLINYPEDVGTPTANLLLIKIFLWSQREVQDLQMSTFPISIS